MWLFREHRRMSKWSVGFVNIHRAWCGPRSSFRHSTILRPTRKQTDEGAPVMCKELGIGWKFNGTRVDDWPMFGVEEEPRKTVGEDDGAAILLVTDFKRLLRASNGGVVVGGGLLCLFAVEVSEVGVIEIRCFLHCGTGVPSFSLSESISTRPSGGGRPVKASSNIIFVNYHE
jgi:hypothetical protein